VADVGEEKTFVDGDVGGVLVGGGVGGALVGVPLPSYVRLATLLLVVVLLLPFLVVVPVTITCIWTFSNIKIGLTTSVANPFGVGFVLLPIPLLKDLSEALNDKSCLLFCCFECNGLHLGCGGRTLLQVDNVFGVFDHNLKDHKLTNHILERHFFIPRILTN
jgi:hypothetical protein